MRTRLQTVTLLALLLTCLPSGPTSCLWASGDPAVPPELEPWSDWVLADRPHLACPFFVSGTFGAPENHPCAWAGVLDLEVGDSSASFSIRWTTYAETWLPLPGGTQNWPLDVTLDGSSTPVLPRGGTPGVLVDEGEHRLRGRLEWDRRPEALPIPPAIGRIRLALDGQEVFPLQRAGGSLWLGRAATEASEADALSVEVYRRLADGVPALLETRIRLDVSGQGREGILGPILPEGFAPTALDSGLQAILEEGDLRLQLRPGRWEVVVHARATAPFDRIDLHAAGAPWPAVEIWSYQSAPELRVSAATGGLAVDPTQVDVPGGWTQLPATRLASGEALQIEERSRGMADDANRLHLTRQIWIDFDGEGMTAHDKIQGRMVRGFRLDTVSPLALARAQAHTLPLLVTTSPADGAVGVEIRNPTVYLETTSRIESSSSVFPVTGWSESFESVTTTLHLPPGRELLAAFGADSSPQAWITRWSLLDLFLVMITTLLTARLVDRRWAAAQATFLILSYQESAGPLWTLLLVVALALLGRALPSSRFARVVRGTLFAAVGLLALVCLPFVAGQLRLALFPQLERYQILGASDDRYPMGSLDPDVEDLAFVQEEMAAEATRSAPASSMPKLGLRSKRLERYALSNVFQAGGGEPAWAWRRADLSWTGPVLPSQEVRLVLTPEWLTRLLRILMVGLLAALAGRIALALRDNDTAEKDRTTPPPAPETALPAAIFAALVLSLPLLAPSAQAQSTPDPGLLAELGQRLSRAPACAPACAHLERADVRATGDALEVRLSVHVAEEAAFPIPTSPAAWNLQTLEIDGRGGHETLAHGGHLWVVLDRGVHSVRLAGALAAVDSAELAFPLRPGRITATAEGWDLAGLTEGHLVTDTLTLVRIRDTPTTTATPTADEGQIAPFVRVERTLDLDLDWSVTTTVHRIAPTSGSLAVRVPLLPEESVLTAGFDVQDAAVVAALPADQASTTWRSRLGRRDSLELTAPDLDLRAEVWRVLVSPQWSATFTGLPATPSNTSQDVEDVWVHEFHPLPGETLRIEVGRPEPVEGPTLALDEASLSLEVGRRARKQSLQMSVRSTRGGQHTIDLPPQAEVLSVDVDGTSLNLRPENGRLTIPVHPGEQKVVVSFREGRGASTWVTSPEIDLGASTSNLSVDLRLPDDRWVLLTHGPRVGPAVLYWAEFLVMLLAASFLARLQRTPLRLVHWVLLGIGFSTFSWTALAVVVVWLLALDARRSAGDAAGKLPHWAFNLLQLGLVGLTFAAIGCLVAAIPFGLLAHPDMHLQGNGSTAHHLQWFDDLSDGPLPVVGALSLPLWIYRIVMLAWALWLASAVIRWIRWGWSCLVEGGGWRKQPEKPQEVIPGLRPTVDRAQNTEPNATARGEGSEADT